MARTLLISFAVLSLTALEGPAQEKLFSGPQVGEKLPPFKVRGFFDDAAGKELDFVTQAAGKPIVLVFIHDVNRPSMYFTRTLTGYTAGRAKDGLATGVIWLADDVTEAEITLKRSGHALAREAPLGISLDGKEGPGSYGLNRNVTLTILVGKEGRVTANFALVQPSLQADLQKVLDAVAKVVGGPVARIEDLPGVREQLAKQKAAPGQPDPKLQGLIRQVIQKTATEEAVTRAAAAVEEHVKQNEAARKEVGRIARTVVEGGKLTDYGTPKAQEYLRKWAKEYGGPASKEKDGGRGGKP
jgi:hypothetical protein